MTNTLKKFIFQETHNKSFYKGYNAFAEGSPLNLLVP